MRQEVVQRVRRIRSVARGYRTRNPLSEPRWSAGSYPLAANVGGVPVLKELAWFPSVGCLWSRSGGCTMCDFGSSLNVDVGRSAELFRAHLEALDIGLQRIHVAPGGSFFDPLEVPETLQADVLRALHRFPFLRGVGIETRPNLLTLPRLLDAVARLPPSVTELTIGFGLESRDDLIRELSVNKGYGPREVVQAAEVIAEANKLQSRVVVDFEVYVLLKPIFVTESEAIEDAVSTIEWSLSVGAGTTVLFLNTVKAHTIQGYLADTDGVPEGTRYRPPYLRSAIEALLRLAPQDRTRVAILGLQSGIGAHGFPRGCSLCSPYLIGTLMAHNLARDVRVLIEASRSWCPCKEAWRNELEQSSDPLLARVDRALDFLEPLFPSP